ncbi:MAG: GTPase HflX [Gammaproteobacteria bacterium]|nr:GTPase HflX [Gammaproteobacteria bacterium]
MQSNPSNLIVLVHVFFPSKGESSSSSAARITSDESLAEFKELARSTEAEIVSVVTSKRVKPAAKYFIGSGKAEELRMLVEAEEVGLVIFNHSLTPAQERNLESLLQCRVLDRTGLILDIFARRARSFEGRLQVELAQLQYLAARVVRGWSHLERQKGGIGLRGPGETQLEVDRRLIGDRIKMIQKRLVKVRSQRAEGRRARLRAEIPTVSLVGYTNAGKSTLFNSLTTASVHAADQLFATLDPTLRRIELPEVGAAILIDTVGFIRHLPHDLVAAFQATLEETVAADLLLHVIDASDPERREKIGAVNQVLKQIGADQIPQLLVYNKIDMIADKEPRLDYTSDSQPRSVRVSAVSNDGLDLLSQALQQLLAGEMGEYEFDLEPGEGKLRARLYRLGIVLKEEVDQAGNCHLTVRLKKRDFLAL